MPTVYRRRKRDGTQAEIYTADIWIDGRKFPRSTGETTRRKAEKRAVELEAELRSELARRYEPLTLDTAAGRYWTEHAGALPSASSVKYHIMRLLEIIGRDLQLAELSNKHVHEYVVHRSRMGVTTGTINRELDVLQSIYNMARDRWEHPVRPLRWRDHRFPPSDKQVEPLTIEEAREAVRLAATRNEDVADGIELSIYTGMRQNELETLVPCRVDLAERIAIVLAKRKARQAYRERPVFLNTPAVALLAERIKPGMDPDQPLFRLTNARKIWEWVRVQIGRPDVRWHDLRHTHGTLLGDKTDVRVIKDSLGHTNIATSLRYVRKRNAQVLAAVETIPSLRERKVVGLG